MMPKVGFWHPHSYTHVYKYASTQIHCHMPTRTDIHTHTIFHKGNKIKPLQWRKFSLSTWSKAILKPCPISMLLSLLAKFLTVSVQCVFTFEPQGDSVKYVTHGSESECRWLFRAWNAQPNLSASHHPRDSF